jgi:DNA-binding PadR family transcriptional regulator
MPRSRLTGFERALVGLISLQPSTGYDLKRRFATTALGVYQPSSGALYPALDRLERRGLLASEALTPAGGRPRRLYRLTEEGSQAQLAWLREPVASETVAQDLGLHLLRFVIMAQTRPAEAVLEFLGRLRSALAGFVAVLERQVDAADAAGNPYPALAVEHGLAVHRASLAWADRAIARLAADSPGA